MKRRGRAGVSTWSGLLEVGRCFRRHVSHSASSRRRDRLLSLVACMAAVQPSSWSLAVAAPADTAASVEGVSVSARREDTPTEHRDSYRGGRSRAATGLALTAQETPQAISTLTRAQLDDLGLNTVNDALMYAPGVTVERVETDRTYYTARGFDIDHFQLDGVGLPFTNGAQWGDVDTLIYDRIEVLRGANGLLTGTGQPSATLNFVRKRPTTAFQASGSASIGSWQTRRLTGDVSGALNADGGVRGRLVGPHRTATATSIAMANASPRCTARWMWISPVT